MSQSTVIPEGGSTFIPEGGSSRDGENIDNVDTEADRLKRQVHRDLHLEGRFTQGDRLTYSFMR